MTPCEKLGYKVGDKFEVIGEAGFGFKLGDIAVLSDDDGTVLPMFINEKTGKMAHLYIPDESGEFPQGGVFAKHLKSSVKDPIDYLKTAYAEGLVIHPATMLRECFGITKTARTVVEWHEPKERKIKVGDRVKVVGDSVNYWPKEYKIGDIATVSETDDRGIRINLGGGLLLWFPRTSLELV